MRFYKKIIAILTGLVIMGGVAYAQIGGGISYPNFFYISGDNILPIDTNYELGSTGTRWKKIWATDIDTTNLLVGGVISGNLDLNGNCLILDAAGTSSLCADSDNQIDFEINSADDFQMTANTFTALSGSSIATNTIVETTGGSGVTIDSIKLIDGGATVFTGGTDTFNITNGTGSLDVAAASALNVDANLTVEAASFVNQDLTTDASVAFTGLSNTDAAITNVSDIALDSISPDATDISITIGAGELGIGDGTYAFGHSPNVGIEGIFEVDGILYADSNIQMANDTWFTGRNNADDGNVNMFKLWTDDTIVPGAPMALGSYEVEEDAGVFAWIDFPVSATPAATTEESISFSIDSNTLLKLYAEADSAGGIQNPRVVAEQGVYSMAETTTPTAVADYGAIYTKADNFLYFQDGAGVEKEIISADENFGSMFLDANAVATTIETANIPIALRQYSTGSPIQDFTFDAGSTGAITAYSNPGGGLVNAVSAGHGLSTGDIVSIRGTTNYNGIFEITDVDGGNFTFTDTWVADDGASDWDQGSALTVGTGAAGDYILNWSLSTSEAGGAGSTVTFAIYVDATINDESRTQRKFANNDVGAMSGNTILALAEGDQVFLTASSSGTNTFTNAYGQVVLHRL